MSKMKNAEYAQYLDKRREIMETMVNNPEYNSPKTGKPSFVVAVQRNPSWRAELKFDDKIFRDRLYPALTALRKHMARSGNGNGRPGPAKHRKQQQPRLKQYTPQEIALVRRIMADKAFQRGDQIAWKQAFTLHPEWKEQVFKSKQSFAALVARVRAGQGSSIPLEAPQRLAEAAHVEVAPLPERFLLGDKVWTHAEVIQKLQLVPCNFCPNCGADMQMHNRAFSVQRRHAQ